MLSCHFDTAKRLLRRFVIKNTPISSSSTRFRGNKENKKYNDESSYEIKLNWITGVSVELEMHCTRILLFFLGFKCQTQCVVCVCACYLLLSLAF